MTDIKATIAKNITELRTARGMTQLELAEQLHYSDKAVSKWERGESVPEISTLKLIADLFGVTTDYLLRQTEKKTRPAVEQKKDWIDKLAYIVKTKGYLAGWVLIAWGALDLIGVLWMVLMTLGVGVGSLFW